MDVNYSSINNNQRNAEILKLKKNNCVTALKSGREQQQAAITNNKKQEKIIGIKNTTRPNLKAQKKDQ